MSNKLTPKKVSNFSMIDGKSFMAASLQEFVNRTMREKSLSSYAVARASRDGITQSHVNRIQNGEVTNPSKDKLIALAKGLGVTESEIFSAARSVNNDTSEISHERLQVINFAYEGMPKKKKQKADYLIELLEREIKRIIEEKE